MPPPPPFQVNSWRLAEENAATWMRWWGYPDAQLTENGSDGGVDIRARGALAQVKAEVTQTGLPAMQRLPGARSPASQQALFFFSGAGFTKPALACADEWNIACFTYDMFGAMTPVNAAARRVLRQVEERETAAQRAREEAAAAEARREAEEREAAARRSRERERAAEEEAAARRSREQERAAEEEAASRRQREARLADERRMAEKRASVKAHHRRAARRRAASAGSFADARPQARKPAPATAQEPTMAERRAADAQAFAEARRRADARVEAALQASLRSTTYAHSSAGRTTGDPFGVARDARRVTEPQRVRATRADAPARTRKPATMSPKSQPPKSGTTTSATAPKKRRTMPRLMGALVCLALAAFALVNALTNADAGGMAGVAIFTVLAVLFFSSYRAAVGHNRALANTPR